MKILNCPGEFAFKALICRGCGWILSDRYFFSLQECSDAQTDFTIAEIKWPVEVMDDGSVYIPSKKELEEGN